MENNGRDEELDRIWLACLKSAYGGVAVECWSAMLEMKSCTIKYEIESNTEQNLSEKITFNLPGVQLPLSSMKNVIDRAIIDKLVANAALHILIPLNEHCHYERKIATGGSRGAGDSGSGRQKNTDPGKTPAGEQVSRDQWERVEGVGTGKSRR